MKSNLQQVNSRIRCYEAALSRCGLDVASLLLLDASQNVTAAEVPGASSANGTSNCAERTETGAAELGTSASSASVSRPTKTLASESKSSTRSPNAAAVDPSRAAQQPAVKYNASNVQLDVHETLQQPPKDA